MTRVRSAGSSSRCWTSNAFMFFTARQLDDLHRKNGAIVLPYRARLTPLAADWARSKKLIIGYGEVEGPGKVESQPAAPQSTETAALLWWCDGPAGATKAAIAMQSRQSPMRSLEVASDARQIAAAIRR